MAYGLIVGPGSYLRRQWTNALDLTLVVLGCARAHSRSLFGASAAVSPCLRPRICASACTLGACACADSSARGSEVGPAAPSLRGASWIDCVAVRRLIRAGRGGARGSKVRLSASSVRGECGSAAGLSAPSVRGACGSLSAPWPPQPRRPAQRGRGQPDGRPLRPGPPPAPRALQGGAVNNFDLF